MATQKLNVIIRRVSEQHKKLLESITEDGGCRVACPHCGTTFLIQPSQTEGLCFACLRPFSAKEAVRDALAEKAHPGAGGFQALTQLAAGQLAGAMYTAAEKTYRELAAADVENGTVWRGLLAADTRNYSDLDKKPPEAVYSHALAFSSGADARELMEKWRLYTKAYQQRQEQLERARRRQEEQQRRVREEEERTRAQEQRTQQVQQETHGKGNGSRAARIILRLLLIGGGLLLVLALLASGAGFFGIMLLFGLFGSVGRDNNNRRRR